MYAGTMMNERTSLVKGWGINLPVRKSDAEPSLIRFYLSETQRHIGTMEQALALLANAKAMGEMNEALFNSQMQQILFSLRTVVDLAMIHGFDAVHALGLKLEAGARFIHRRGAAGDFNLVEKLLPAIASLRQMIYIEDEYEAEQVIKEVSRQFNAPDETILSLDIVEPEFARSRSVGTKGQADGLVKRKRLLSAHAGTLLKAKHLKDQPPNGQSLERPALGRPLDGNGKRSNRREPKADSPAAEDQIPEVTEENDYAEQVQVVPKINGAAVRERVLEAEKENDFKEELQVLPPSPSSPIEMGSESEARFTTLEFGSGLYPVTHYLEDGREIFIEPVRPTQMEELDNPVEYFETEAIQIETVSDARIDEVFDEIVSIQVKERLDRLQRCWQQFRHHKNVVLTIQEVCEACSDLKVIADKLKNPSVNALVLAMHRLAHEKLDLGGFSAGLVAAFEEAENLIRRSLDEHVTADEMEAGRVALENHLNDELPMAKLLKDQPPKGQSLERPAFGRSLEGQWSPQLAPEPSAEPETKETGSSEDEEVFSLESEELASTEEDEAFRDENASEFAFDFQDVEEEPLPPPKRSMLHRIKNAFGMQ